MTTDWLEIKEIAQRRGIDDYWLARFYGAFREKIGREPNQADLKIAKRWSERGCSPEISAAHAIKKGVHNG